MSSDSPSVFLSYSHKDEALKARLETHLKVVQGRLDVWEDRQLHAGDDWLDGISEAIASANAAVLLISADFLTSEFILRQEVPQLLERRAKDGVAIIPVLLKDCPWQEIPWLSALQIRPTDARAVTALRGNAREKALADIAREVLVLAQKHQETSSDTDSRSAAPAQLAEKLEAAYQRLEELVSTGGDTRQQREIILDLKRRLREDGQLKPGDVLGEGRYKLLEVLGRGGFATVFKAYDRRTRTEVAIKVLHAQLAQDQRRRQRFFLGARKMGELQHQAIVRVIEPESQDGGYHYFVMEYVDGGDLRQAVTSGKIGGVQGLALLEDVAEALDLAHRNGLVHRDVKPANILLTADRQAKLSDFDLVRALDTTFGTRTSSTIGTILYMAPEAMLAAENAKAAADIYSLGMCAAFVLHREEIPVSILRDYQGFFNRLAAADGLKRVLRQATAEKPEERFGSAAEFWQVLSDAAQAVDLSAAEQSTDSEDPFSETSDVELLHTEGEAKANDLTRKEDQVTWQEFDHLDVARELVNIFGNGNAASALLLMIGFPPAQIPPTSQSAGEFWAKVISLLRAGVIHNAPTNLVQEAARRFPGNETFSAAVNQAAPAQSQAESDAVNTADSGAPVQFANSDSQVTWQEFDRSDVAHELATVFGDGSAARALLLMIGFPPGRIPIASNNAYEFWAEVIGLLRAGVIHNAPTNLVREAARLYPGNETFNVWLAQAAPAQPQAIAHTADASTAAQTIDSADQNLLIAELRARLAKERALELSRAPENDEPTNRIDVMPNESRGYLYRRLFVEGPDQERYELYDMPGSTRVKDVTRAVIDVYYRSWPRTRDGKPRRAILDRVDETGKRERLDANKTLNASETQEDDTLHIAPEFPAGKSGVD